MKKNNQIAHRRIEGRKGNPKEIWAKQQFASHRPGAWSDQNGAALKTSEWNIFDSQPEKGTTVHASVPLCSASVMRAAG
jgi:hypothetical protein